MVKSGNQRRRDDLGLECPHLPATINGTHEARKPTPLSVSGTDVSVDAYRAFENYFSQASAKSNSDMPTLVAQPCEPRQPGILHPLIPNFISSRVHASADGKPIEQAAAPMADIKELIKTNAPPLSSLDSGCPVGIAGRARGVLKRQRG